jgi:hypothetical protein
MRQCPVQVQTWPVHNFHECFRALRMNGTGGPGCATVGHQNSLGSGAARNLPSECYARDKLRTNEMFEGGPIGIRLGVALDGEILAWTTSTAIDIIGNFAQCDNHTRNVSSLAATCVSTIR